MTTTNNKVLNFPEKGAWNTGEAKCLTCGHKWSARAPVGALFFKCPECDTHKGTMIFKCERDEPHYVCNCGNIYFCNTESRTYCPNCGLDHEF